MPCLVSLVEQSVYSSWRVQQLAIILAVQQQSNYPNPKCIDIQATQRDMHWVAEFQEAVTTAVIQIMLELQHLWPADHDSTAEGSLCNNFQGGQEKQFSNDIFTVNELKCLSNDLPSK